MNAVILAAGMSRRLGNITLNKPKCLLEILDTTIIEYQINLLKKIGISRIVIVVGYKKEIIIDKLYNYDNIKFVINEDFENTNSSYSLYLSKNMLNGNPFIYLNSDLIINESTLNELINGSNSFRCILDNKRKNKDIDSFKAIVQDNFVKKMGKEINSGIEVPGPFYLNSKISTELFNLLDKVINKDKNMWVYSIFNMLANRFDLTGIYTNEKWFEVDTEEDYNKVKKIKII